MTDATSPTKYLEGIEKPRKGSIVIDPFTGDGAMMKWVGTDNIRLMYDAEPSQPGTIRRDSLAIGTQWSGGFIVTCPPVKRKAEAEQEASDPNHRTIYDLSVFDRWGTDDLYKCFLKSILRSHTLGGVLVLPAEFLTSYRASDTERRRNFFRYYYIKRANLFTNEFLPGTKQLPLAIEFERLTEYYAQYNSAAEARQKILTINVYPENKVVQYQYDFGDHTCPLMDALRHLPILPTKRRIKCRNLNTDTQKHQIQPADTVTNIVVSIADINKFNLPIQTVYVDDENPPLFKQPYRLVITGVVSKRLQKRLVADINDIINKWREETQSIYLSYISEPTKSQQPIGVANPRLFEKAVERLIHSYSLA